MPELSWNQILDIELRNRDNPDVVLLIDALRQALVDADDLREALDRAECGLDA